MAVAINRQWNGNRQRRERAQRARHDEMFLCGSDAAFRTLAGNQAEADGEKSIAAQGVIWSGVAGDDAGAAKQHVGEPAFVFEPKKFLERRGRVVGKVVPFF